MDGWVGGWVAPLCFSWADHNVVVFVANPEADETITVRRFLSILRISDKLNAVVYVDNTSHISFQHRAFFLTHMLKKRDLS